MNIYDSTKWCVHVRGKDEVIEYDDFETAVKEANNLNQLFLTEYKKHPNDENYPRVWAQVAVFEQV